MPARPDLPRGGPAGVGPSRSRSEPHLAGAGDSARTASSASAPDGTESSGSSAPVSLLSAADIGRTLDRIAHQILERAGDAPVVLVGIPTRGVFLARRLGARLTAFTTRPYPVGSLDITLYRDDLRRRPPRALEETVLPESGIEGATVVLVDDVLYSGRTVRAALDALRDHGRPAVVQLAVLVDRGHRRLPIRADYVGKNIPTALADDVAVQLAEIDGVDGVDLRRGVS